MEGLPLMYQKVTALFLYRQVRMYSDRKKERNIYA